jgi:transposase-like protein
MQTDVPKIIQLYQDELLSIEQIAKALHISSSTVHKWLVRKNVERRTKTSNVNTRVVPLGHTHRSTSEHAEVEDEDTVGVNKR